MKPNLYAVYYRKGREHRLLGRIMAPDSQTAIKQARSLFKETLARLNGIELCSQMLPLERSVLKAKDPA